MAAGRLDRELERYLVPGETVVTVVRQHWFSQVRPIALFVGLLFLATFVEAESPQTRGGAFLANVFWYAALAGGFYLLWRYLNWRHDWFVATDKRFLLFYGFLRRKVAMMPLTKVTDMTFDRSLLGRIIGYGTFLLESAGQDQALGHIEYVPDAERHYRAICTVLFGADAPVDPDDEWVEDGDDDGPDGRVGLGGHGPTGPGGDDGWSPDLDSGWEDTTMSGGDDGWRHDPYRRTPGIRNPVRDRHDIAPPHETLYQSPDLVRASRTADTGEIPVIRPIRSRTTRRKGRP
ncbi:PH domain-containing protein [Knoellia sp. CPCC 206435]|uniref:PH domain-containing protein n=1 Tax=Knoellia terrae TaxID=3404797 RepID=UPI003B43C9E7